MTRFPSTRSTIVFRRVCLVWMALLLLGAVGSVAAQDSMKAEALAVLEKIDQASSNLDADGYVKHLAPEAHVKISNCGEPTLELSKAEYQEVLEIVLTNVDSYELQRSIEDSVLSEEFRVTIRSRTLEKIVAPEFEVEADSQATIILDKIGNEYKIISIESIETCQNSRPSQN